MKVLPTPTTQSFILLLGHFSFRIVTSYAVVIVSVCSFDTQHSLFLHTGEMSEFPRHMFGNGHLKLEKQMNDFFESTTMTTHDINRRESLIRDLNLVLVRTSASCTLHPVGSFYTGICDAQSDLNIFVDTTGSGGMYEVRRVLEGAPNIFSDVNLINARIPLIHFIHVQTGIHVDLSFCGSENNGRRKSGLIDSYLNVKPRIFRPLLTLIRYWSKYNGLAGAKELKNYALTLLVLNFLMRKKLIVSVQKMAHKYRFHNDFGYNKNKLPAVRNSQLNFEETVEILELAEEFFKSFAGFESDKNVICCVTGEWIPKEVFNKVDQGVSTPGPGSYVYDQWLASKKTGTSRLNYESVLCIQDPFNLRTNVAHMVNSALLDKFKTACRKTAPRIRMILNNSRTKNSSINLLN